MIELTLNQLRQLKLNGMASALQTQGEQPGTYEGLAFAERLQLLVDHEDQVRHRNGPAAPHGLPGLILASSHFLVRISHENKRTLVAACRNLV